MLNIIIKNALHNRAVVLVIAVLLMLAGAWVTTQVDVDVFPDLTAPTVTVMTEAHGMSAEEMERLVTFKLETALNGAPNVRRIRSTSSSELSSVIVEFDWGTDIYRARQIVNERLGTVQSDLPDKVKTPVMAPIASIMGEIQMIGMSSDSLSGIEMNTLANWYIKPRLLAVEGVAKVIIYGGQEKEYQVLASPAKMKLHHVSLEELYQAIEQLNHNASGGYLEQYGKQYLISGKGRIRSIQEIEEAFVKMEGEVAIRVGDLADVKIGGAPKLGNASINGQDALTLTILKQPSANTLKLTQEIDKTVQEIAKNLPTSVELNPALFKQGDFIENSINNLQRVLLEGIFFVILVLFLFLMEWRTTLISVITIPLSLLTSILVLYWTGFSINTMTLGGLAIAVGVLVDDAIVDVENVYKRLRQNAILPIDQQRSKLTIIYEATFEVRSSILNSSLIIIASFLPLFFLSGVEGRLLQPLGIAFLIVIVVSLLVAVAITPALCSVLLKTDAQAEETETQKINYNIVIRSLMRLYNKVLKLSLNRSYVVLGVAFVLLVISIVTMSSLGRSFLPDFNEGSLTISVVVPPETSLTETNKIGTKVEQLLLEIPEVDLVGRRTGRASMDEHAQSHYASEIEVPLNMKERSKSEVLADIRAKIGALPGVTINIGQPISHRIDHMISGTRSNVAIKLFGEDLTKMFQIGNEIKQNISSIDGIVDVNLDQKTEIPHIYIYPKHEMLARSGISIEQFANFIDMAIGGKTVVQVYENQRSFNLKLRLEEKARDKIEKLEHLLIENFEGDKIPFGKVARIVSNSSPERISRENVHRKLVIATNVANRDLKSAVEEIQATIAQNVQLPEGYHLEYGGQFENEQKATSMLLLTSLFSLVIIFFLILREFKEFWLSIIILTNLPLALIGGIFMIYFDSGIISIASTIGFISLFGIATRNGMLLISRYQVLLEEGKSLKKAIVEGSLDRLNPILMTATTTGLALIPLILAGGQAGNEIQSPMAVVIVGGLVSSTLLNLVVVPCTFYLLKQKTHA
ncbi:efflux RND transporter permease subunit [Aureispira sp. CCB-E]|uniref:efflux RND transporter permease subunit n=1 Tax=Aureispira sp. CCB-E TaxID=3051121 RepID=UPI0028697FBD|nr:efflux RND transporter permease subunit [Aureispira sp. CCB-E]WMX13905.1 efflux RND transporter permease subunit [Aureispira sp. CCB-E]